MVAVHRTLNKLFFLCRDKKDRLVFQVLLAQKEQMHFLEMGLRDLKVKSDIQVSMYIVHFLDCSKHDYSYNSIQYH